MCAERGAGLSDRFHFSVARRIASGNHPVEPLADDFSGVNHHRTERTSGPFDECPVTPKLNRFPHKTLVLHAVIFSLRAPAASKNMFFGATMRSDSVLSPDPAIEDFDRINRINRMSKK